MSHRLTREELQQFDEDGFVVRERVFSDDEVARIRADCEALVERVARGRTGPRTTMGSYVFEPDPELDVTIKWEGDTDHVHGLEPFAHISPEMRVLADDIRFREPMIDMVGDPDPTLFTEKLNLKRPGVGGRNPLHQDYPYWVGVAEAPERIVTSILFLDDSTLENGCLHVVPGSHRAGVWPTRTDGDWFARHETDPRAGEGVEQRPVEVPAGSLLSFGSLLVHSSAPNTSDMHRRALLFSYQQPGHRTMVDALRERRAAS